MDSDQLADPDPARAGNQPQAYIPRDPVCDMEIDPEKTGGPVLYRDKRYFFCCEGCRSRFLTEPELYAERRGASNNPPCGKSAADDGV